MKDAMPYMAMRNVSPLSTINTRISQSIKSVIKSRLSIHTYVLNLFQLPGALQAGQNLLALYRIVPWSPRASINNHNVQQLETYVQ